MGLSCFGVIVNVLLGHTVTTCTTNLLHFVKMCRILLTPSQLKQFIEKSRNYMYMFAYLGGNKPKQRV